MLTAEYEDDYEELARLQQIDLEEQDTVDDMTELEEDNLRQGTDREGRGKKKGGKKKGDKKKKGGSGKNRKSVKLPNRHGAEIRTWGQVMLFNVRADPEERVDLASSLPEEVARLKGRAAQHFLELQPQFTPDDDPRGDPVRWGGYWGPGWCELRNIYNN